MMVAIIVICMVALVIMFGIWCAVRLSSEMEEELNERKKDENR